MLKTYYSQNRNAIFDNGVLFIRFKNGMYQTDNKAEQIALEKGGYPKEPLIKSNSNREADLRTLVLQLQQQVRGLNSIVAEKDALIAQLQSKKKKPDDNEGGIE